MWKVSGAAWSSGRSVRVGSGEFSCSLFVVVGVFESGFLCLLFVAGVFRLCCGGVCCSCVLSVWLSCCMVVAMAGCRVINSSMITIIMPIILIIFICSKIYSPNSIVVKLY